MGATVTNGGSMNGHNKAPAHVNNINAVFHDSESAATAPSQNPVPAL